MGYKTKTCDRCDGSGWLDASCPRCGGSGLEDSGEWCRMCGNISPDSINQKCEACNGSGEVEVDEDSPED